LNRLRAAIPVMLACLACGCAPATPTPAPAPLTVLATPDLAPLAAALAETYNRSQVHYRATLSMVTQRQVPAALQQYNGSLAITYPLAAAEGISDTVVALDGIAVSVAFSNSVESLTLAQVRQIFTGGAADWTEVGGRPGGITALYRDEGAPSREVFERVIMGGNLRVTRNALLVASDAGMVDSISATPGAIGYASLRALTPQVRPLRLDGVPPSAAAIQQGKYPLVVPVLLLTHGEMAAGARSFLAFVQGREGEPVLQNQGFVKPR
jgi:ABC-type phosphate transport system substrate-binding protein